MEQIRKLLKDLENEISSEKFIKLYQRVREKYPPIKSYLTPQDLIQCLHNQANLTRPIPTISSMIKSYQVLFWNTRPIQIQISLAHTFLFSLNPAYSKSSSILEKE
jgi:hypothetical protein